jgi:DNA mismatch endonuclease (patch repair protein)
MKESERDAPETACGGTPQPPSVGVTLRFEMFAFRLDRLRMTDVFTPEKRSEVMSRVRGRDTKPELALRSMLHRMGYRFTVKGPLNRGLPGKPDLVLPKYRTVIFVHGCFWHGHDSCAAFRLPKARSAWWSEKIAGNKARDLRAENELLSRGWHVVTIWECALKTAAAREWLAGRLPGLLGR